MPREMKDSGIEWIGEIPKDWKIDKVKHLGVATNGLTYKPQDLKDEHDGLLVLRAANIKNGALSLEDNVYVAEQIGVTSLVKAGNILICSCNGSAALVGKCCIIPENMISAYGGFMLMFECINVHNRFLYYVFSGGLFDAYRQTFTTTTINQLTIKNLYSLPVPLPDGEEQTLIADYLDHKCSQIEDLKQNLKSEIQDLANFKKSLIFDYVTGKKETPADFRKERSYGE